MLLQALTHLKRKTPRMMMMMTLNLPESLLPSRSLLLRLLRHQGRRRQRLLLSPMARQRLLRPSLPQPKLLLLHQPQRRLPRSARVRKRRKPVQKSLRLNAHASQRVLRKKKLQLLPLRTKRRPRRIPRRSARVRPRWPRLLLNAIVLCDGLEAG